MIPIYIVVLCCALIGWAVSTHHRLRQQQKFKMIELYERELGILDLKKQIIQEGDARAGLPGRIFTGNFIGFMQLGIGFIAIILLARTLWLGA